MRNRAIEIVVGVFIILAFCAIIILAFWVSGLTSVGANGQYNLYADFDNIGGLKVRAPIAIAGVKVGTVTHIKLDPKTFRARVTLNIDRKVNDLPIDSAANILTQGLLGSNYISIAPGFETDELKPNEMIQTTHSAMILENVIGQLIYNVKDDKNGDQDKVKNSKKKG